MDENKVGIGKTDVRHWRGKARRAMPTSFTCLILRKLVLKSWWWLTQKREKSESTYV